MGSGEDTEGEFYGRTTIPECNEGRTAVPSGVKMEGELCSWTQHVSMLHTNTFEGLQG